MRLCFLTMQLRRLNPALGVRELWTRLWSHFVAAHGIRWRQAARSYLLRYYRLLDAVSQSVHS
jgi:hypothetical protein